MKKLVLLICLVFYPCFGNAATAHASLTNFRFEILSGSPPSYDPGSFYSYVTTSINSHTNEDHQETLSAPYFYDISATSTGSYGQAIANISNNPTEPTFASNASATRGTADSWAEAFFSLNYTANTVVKISADAFVSGTATNKDIVTTIVAIRGTDVGLKNFFEPNIGYASYPTAFVDSWSFSQTLSFTYSSPINTTLYFDARTYAAVEINPYIPSYVPEPQQYGLILIGLVILGCRVRRESIFNY